MKKIKIQIIINIITIINIIVITIWLYHFILNSKYSRKYIRELLEKNSNTINYTIEKETSSLESGTVTIEKIAQKEKMRKDEMIDRRQTRWYVNDLIIDSTDETSMDKTYSKRKVTITDENGNKTNRDLTDEEIEALYQPLKDEFHWYNYIDMDNYKYIKKEKCNNVKCLVVEFSEIMGDKTYTNRVWIDEETGFVLKGEEYIEGVLKRIEKFDKIETNSVTDEEIDLPNLEEYTLVP